MSVVDTNTLKWVKSEIDETLKQAQISLEAYVEDTADESQMRFCINYLHQVHGTLQMVELHGAALAVEEMEKLSQAIFDNNVNNKDDAYETLMRGILQVPDYLEHLLAGNPDMPVVLLPLLNDIRAARNEALLSEGALFTPDLSIDAPSVEFTVESGGEGLSSLAKKLRHNYHIGLLAWFQNKNPKAGLQKISDVISELTQAAESDEARRVFWIANGLVESLKDDGVDTSVAVKMLLGHVDRQIKKIIDEGELALDEAPPEELEKNLLYYVATSTTAGAATKEIKEAFKLADIMPDTQTVEQARADLTAPNAALMETVSSVIIEDINKIKDNLDVYVRSDEKDISILEDVSSALTQMSDTLAMLNLGVQREAVLKQTVVIKDIVAGKITDQDAELMNVAAAMIAVENSLSEVSTAKAAASIEVEEGIDAGDAALAQMQGAEQQKLMKTVLDESKVNLTKVKEALTLFSQNNEEREQLKSIPAFLEQIQGSLMILSLEDAANLLTLTNNYIRKNLIKETIPPSLDDMDNLADAISSLEYYMESLMGSWGQPEAILDVAKQSLQALGLNTDEVVEEIEDVTEVIEEAPEVIEEVTTVEDIPEVIEVETFIDEGSLELASEMELSLEDDKADDTLEISNDESSLDELSFDLTDEDSISLSDDNNEISLDEMSLDSLSLDEGLSFDLEDSSPVEESLTEESIELSEDVQDELDTSAVEIKSEQASPQTDKANKPSLLDDTIDDEIIEIFMEEAEEAYETISELLPAWIANTTDDEPLKEIRRAYHTLKGSGRLVGAIDLGEFAWAFENMLNRVLDNSIKAHPDVIELMQQGMQALPELFELFKTGGESGANILQLMEYADALSQGKSINLAGATTPETEINLEAEASIEAIEVEEPTELVESIEFEEPVELVAEEPFPVDIDPVLLEIYRKEVATHVETLKQYIISWNEGEVAPVQSLLRALHTLTGSSRTTGVETLAAVCSSFEHYVKHLQDIEINFPQVAIAELDSTILLVENSIDCLDVPGATLPEHKALLSRVEALPRDIEPAAVKVETPLEINSVEIEVAAPVEDYDEELLEIFLEEGTEILDESDQVIVDWVSNPEDNKYVEELQRHLHTLKGGARMAGIAELGDLGHSIESLLTAVVDGHMKPSKQMFDLVQRSQDRLVKMLELVQDRKGLTAATDLLNEVDLMLQTRGADSELDIAVEIPSVQEIELDDVVEETSEVNEEVSKLSEIDIPELEKLEEELRFEIEDSISFPDLELPEVVEPDIDSGNVIPLDLAEEQPIQEVELTAEIQDPIVPVEDKGDRRKAGRGVQAEQVRVRADLLDNLVNFAGEVSIYRSRLEQQTNTFRYNITEFDDTVNRLREQLRQFEIETETQIEYKSEELSSAQENFDPLEMDRFTTMQHLSRAMMESLGDLDSLRGILTNITRESETLLLQQSRVNTDLQEGLMRTRMVPFSGQAARLRRIVRQTCGELGKHAELHLDGVGTELDRTILERIISPIEHMLRNAVAHGIESPEERKKSAKSETGNIHFSIANEGSEIVIKIKDDGAGINLEAIRSKAISKGLIKTEDAVSKEMLLDMIMQSGFSTADSVSQIAGRGVGMDVVNTEIKQLGGVFNIDTEKDSGTTFTVSLPLTLAISRALMVMVGEDTYAVPLLSVEGVERINASKIKEIMALDEQVYSWVGEDYKFMHLGTVMGTNELQLADDDQQLPMLMVKSGEHRAAILVDNLLGSREIVVKPVGPQLSTLRGISGATVMGDGSVVLIIDLAMLIRLSSTTDNIEAVIPIPIAAAEAEDTTPLVMVVDDSITVRKVTTRLLERHEMRVVAAKDGVDALAQLQEIIPDIMLLDVEMPRMDGFELATNMRGDDKLKDIPIIMITSRTGQKHRDRASSIGVNIYMGKPFTEADLLDNINVLTGQDL
ncbi:MAG: Hpt domain-containing protein [Gammaproteobacteria bacterium]|nr:Hpt domain-containing protein [Gammaproteobacteria bacterium]